MDVRLAVRIAVRKLKTSGLRTTLLDAFRMLGGFLGAGDAVDPFDLECGTDTGGIVPLWKLELDSPNAAFGVKYQPSDEQEVRDAVGFLSEEPGNLVFVDLGCGKGRALLVAAKLGFKQVIGVEFARELAEIARENVAKMNVANVSVVQSDAADFQFPESDMVVYLYNPFLSQVMEKVVANLKQSRAKKVFVIYKVPNCRDLFDDSGFLTRVGCPPARPYMQVWKAVTP